MVGRLKGMGRKGVAVGRLRIAVRRRNARWDRAVNLSLMEHKIALVMNVNFQKNMTNGIACMNFMLCAMKANGILRIQIHIIGSIHAKRDTGIVLIREMEKKGRFLSVI